MNKTTFYFAIWAVLVGATLLEVYTSSLGVAYTLVIGGIVLIAAGKASLVALFYQRLFYESKYLSLLPLGALVALLLLLGTTLLGGGAH